jgi:hypothetical protein
MVTHSSDKSNWGARFAMRLWDPFVPPSLTPSQMQDLRLAASNAHSAPFSALLKPF